MKKSKADLPNSTSPAALVAAMPTVDEILAAAKDFLAVKTQVRIERGVELRADEAALVIAAGNLTDAAGRHGAGEDVDPKELDRLKLTLALAMVAADFSRTAHSESERQEQAAATEVKKALRNVKLRDAKQKLRLVSSAEKAHALSGDTFVTTGKAVLAARADQMATADEAEGLRLELAGIDPNTRPYAYSHELEVRRVMANLPIEWLREAANGGFPVGSVSFHEISARTLERSAD